MAGSSGNGGTTTGGVTTTGGSGTSGGVSCQTSSDCPGETPCCELGTLVCGLPPTVNGFCRCSQSAECSFIDDAECVPLVIAASGVTDGPYICVNNDGIEWDGCQGTSCLDAGEHCSTDKTGNEFCSGACTSDSSCNNPGVACCNAACQDGGMCCGLCENTSGAGACETSTDCGGATPCCSISGSCIATPTEDGICRCSRTSECDFLAGKECAPAAGSPCPGVLTGPYFCFDNDGEGFEGCQGEPCVGAQTGCPGNPTQYCSTDKAGNDFCSFACTSDSSCGNPGVACCNAACQDGGMCCGLCGN